MTSKAVKKKSKHHNPKSLKNELFWQKWSEDGPMWRQTGDRDKNGSKGQKKGSKVTKKIPFKSHPWFTDGQKGSKVAKNGSKVI